MRNEFECINDIDFQGRPFITPPRNPGVYYNNSNYSQPSIMNRDGSLNNPGNGTNPNNPNTYLSDLHSHSVQNKFPHVRINDSP